MWFIEYDQETFSKPFLKINYLKYIQKGSQPEPSNTYSFSQNYFECTLQQQLIDQNKLLQ